MVCDISTTIIVLSMWFLVCEFMYVYRFHSLTIFVPIIIIVVTVARRPNNQIICVCIIKLTFSKTVLVIQQYV